MSEATRAIVQWIGLIITGLGVGFLAGNKKSGFAVIVVGIFVWILGLLFLQKVIQESNNNQQEEQPVNMPTTGL